MNEVAIAFGSALLGALIGALVGGFFTLKGAVTGANEAAKHALELAHQEREQASEERTRLALEAILTEVETILSMLVGAETTNVLRVFPTSVWLQFNGETSRLPEGHRKHVTDGYAHVLLANSFAEYDLIKLGHLMGYVTGEYRLEVRSIRSAFERAMPALEGWLQQSSTSKA